MDNVASSTTSSIATRKNRRRIQDYLLIWVDSKIDLKNEDYQNVLDNWRSVITEVKICTKSAQCVQYLNDMDDENGFIILSSALGQYLMPIIHDMRQVNAIYICSSNEDGDQEWTKDWPKIKGVFTEIGSICESLKKVTHECDHNTISISFIPKTTTRKVTSSIQEILHELPSSFMYSMLFKEIVLEIDEDESKAIENLISYCRDKGIPETQLQRLQKTYQEKSPIWWYTLDNFLHRMLNKSLRSLDMETMYKMGFFIRSLHQKLVQLHQYQLDLFKEQFVVYRGQSLSKQDFQRVFDTKGGLLSFNNFLSTTKAYDVAMGFIECALEYNDNVPVLFSMIIDPEKISISTAAYALIGQYSAIPSEEEILFSMHSVFRIEDIKQLTSNNQIWEVQLILTDEDDSQLSALTHRIRQDIDGEGWYRMGQLMLQMGHFEQAEELYNELLKNNSYDSNRADIFHQCGRVKYKQGKYQEAVDFYEKSLEIKRKTLPNYDSSLVQTNNNIALAYNSMGDYLKALEYYEKNVEITEKTLHSNHPNLATSYSNIGGLYLDMGDYLKAFEYYEKALEIRETALPSNHPDLATSYNNIGGLYLDKGDYSKALEYYEKNLKIEEKVLPPNHPNLATTYNNIGAIYRDVGDYSKAFEYYEKSLKIREISLPPNHPRLAASYDNIGGIFREMCDLLKALDYYKKSLAIREIALPSNHPDLAVSHLCLAACYESIGDYTAALKAIQYGYEIQQKTFQKDHLAFATTFSWYGRVYRSMKDYTKSLDFFQKCLTIVQQSLSEKHPNTAITYNNIGNIYQLMGDHEKSLSYYQQALNIQETVQCSPLDCATTYINIGECYFEMKDYQVALKYYEKSLEIRQNKLPKNHIDLAKIHHKMSKLYLSIEQYSIAMQNIQVALEIGQQKLLSTHPYLLEYRDTFEKIQNKL